MTNKRPLTDTDEPIGTTTPDSAAESDVLGHSILHEGFQRPPATSRNAERSTGHGCRTPARTPPTRRGDR